MRFGLIGDIHAEDDLLERVLAWMRPRADAILFVGDIPDGTGDIDRCVALLEAVGAIGVRGNHERWFLADTMRTPVYARTHRIDETSERTVRFLRALPATRNIPTPLGKLLLCHGMRGNDMGGLRPDDVRAHHER